MYLIVGNMKVLKHGEVAAIETVHTVTENRQGRRGMKTCQWKHWTLHRVHWELSTFKNNFSVSDVSEKL